MGRGAAAVRGGRPLRRRAHAQRLQPRDARRARRPRRTALAAAGGNVAPAGIETEVFAYGRLPLAYSARCFSARHYNLPKDDCQFRCLDHPDGLALATREGEPFLTLNGIQTQSAGVYNLIGELPALRELGVASLRLSPQSRHMGRVVEAFSAALAGEGNAAEKLARVVPGPAVDGYWHGRAGLEHSTGGRTCDVRIP